MKLRAVRNLKVILIQMKKISEVERFQEQGNRSALSGEHVSGLPVRVIQSDDLFGSESEIGIVHQGAMYRLRVTRGGKLILNK
jgi:hemin uptake protein HemP